MNSIVLVLTIMTATLVAVTVHAWRVGDEKRDVVFLGVTAGLCGVGTAAAAVL